MIKLKNIFCLFVKNDFSSKVFAFAILANNKGVLQPRNKNQTAYHFVVFCCCWRIFDETGFDQPSGYLKKKKCVPCCIPFRILGYYYCMSFCVALYIFLFLISSILPILKSINVGNADCHATHVAVERF